MLTWERKLVDVADVEFEGAVLFTGLMGRIDDEDALVAGLGEVHGEAVAHRQALWGPRFNRHNFARYPSGWGPVAVRRGPRRGCPRYTSIC